MPTRQSADTLYDIHIEGKGIEVERQVNEWTARQILNLIMGGVESPNSKSDDAEQAASPGEVQHEPKEFMVSKKPHTDIERITCLAFFLSHYRNVKFFKTRDLTKLNQEAAQPNFSNATVATKNAAALQYLVPAGGGMRQISSKGEALVKALPDRERAKASLKALGTTHKPRRRHTPKVPAT